MAFDAQSRRCGFCVSVDCEFGEQGLGGDESAAAGGDDGAECGGVVFLIDCSMGS